MSVKPRILLIDALAVAYKAYFAFINRPLKTKSGFPTSAIFGFITQLTKILEDVQPDYCVVAFDHKEPTFRHKEYPLYKANRAQMPDDMIPQLQKIRDVLEVMNMPVAILPGFEADDLIGTLSKRAAEAGMQVFMATPDKDYVQLINDSVYMIKPGKSQDEPEIITPEKAKEEYGFNPPQIIDYLALIGDSSDNVPGVKGIGPKGAVPLIQQYGSVENIYEHIDEITSASVKNKLTEGKESALLSKYLVTIVTEVPFQFDLGRAKLQHPDYERLTPLLDELEIRAPYVKLKQFYQNKFNEVVPEPAPAEAATFATVATEYRLITSVTEAEEAARELQKHSELVFDTETDGLDTRSLLLAGASFCTCKGKAFFIAVNPEGAHGDLFGADLSDRLPLPEFVRIFRPLLENPLIKKICQNGKYDIAVMRSVGIMIEGFYFDTMIAGYLLDPDQKIGMDDLSEKYLDYKPIPLSQLLGTKKDAKRIFDVPLQQLANYAAEDADITYQLFQKTRELLALDKLEKVAYDIDFPLVVTLEEMENNGIRVDSDILKQFSADLQKMLDGLSQRICSMAGEQFNINSTQQLQKILFDKLKLPLTKKTKTGYSTDAQALESLRGSHDIIEELLSYRQISKLKSTYSDALPELIHPKTGKIHTTFNQTIAATGRLSSIDPNLQNIPIRTELGKEIRKAFIPSDEEHTILSADYSQIELRIMASMCGDEHLIDAFTRGEDIHRRTAALVFKVTPEAVTPDMRRKAKEVNFGIMYGLGAFGLKTRLGITQAEAKNIILTYNETFPRIAEFIETCKIFARERGYAETLSGRRRYLRNINSSNVLIKQFEERVAVNMPIQGTAADMIKIAMNNIHARLKQLGLRTKMVLQVHDELVFDVYKPELDQVKALVKELMENALPLKVPVTVEMGHGNNWIEAH